MKKSTIFFGIALALLTLLSACSQTIPRWTLEKATAICAEHDGIHQIIAENLFSNLYLTCVDGYSIVLEDTANE